MRNINWNKKNNSLKRSGFGFDYSYIMAEPRQGFQRFYIENSYVAGLDQNDLRSEL
jgi:hypothetical protein